MPCPCGWRHRPHPQYSCQQLQKMNHFSACKCGMHISLTRGINEAICGMLRKPSHHAKTQDYLCPKLVSWSCAPLPNIYFQMCMYWDCSCRRIPAHMVAFFMAFSWQLGSLIPVVLWYIEANKNRQFLYEWCIYPPIPCVWILSMFCTEILPLTWAFLTLHDFWWP